MVSPATPTPDTTSSATQQADVLVVDDKPDNIRLLSDMLIQHGYHVRKAISGEMALRATAALPPDLILLDINMPGMNGYEVCRRLKQADERQSAVPVIFLSALSDAIDKVRAFEIGGADYITKPFRVEEVMARIENQLTIRNLQRERDAQNQELRAALTQLERTQAELVQREKIHALGRLVAGVAHEINNPVSFIAGNLTPARDYVTTLLELLELYQQAYPEPTAEIAEALDDAELEFLTADLDKLLNSMQNGAERIRNIVLALRIFARLDEAPVKTVDLHEGLESALTLLQSRWQGDRPVQVERDYGELPLVQCYARDLNQVFLNLLSNALDALEAAAPAEPTLHIQTRYQGDRVQVVIRDNGIGMSAETQARAFDPFFSDKPIGQGTGLGLAASYQIVVDQHGGELTCQSTPGAGSEFTLAIPARFSAAAAAAFS